MDKIVWTLIDKTSGLPVPNKTTVAARPVQNSTSAGDVPMPEVGTGTAIYATANQIPHGIYRIFVDSTDTLDEVTVEPGRVKWTKATASDANYPVLDRITDAKCVLAGVLDDTVALAGSADLVLAIQSAAGEKPRELILDQDVTLSASVMELTGPLLIDLNGRKLTLNADISSTKRICIRNGLIEWGDQRSIASTDSVTFESVRFSGTTMTMGNSNVSYIGCSGLTTHFGASGNNGSVVASVLGGQNTIGHIGQIKLTDLGANDGSGRVTWLQALIDTWYTWLNTWKAAVEWLTTSRRSILDQWVNYSQPIRDGIGNLSSENIKAIADIAEGGTWVGGSPILHLTDMIPHCVRVGVIQRKHPASNWSVLEGVLISTVTAEPDQSLPYANFSYPICGTPGSEWNDVSVSAAERYRQRVKVYRKLITDVSSPLEEVPINLDNGSFITVSHDLNANTGMIGVRIAVNTSILPYPSGKTFTSYYYVVDFSLCPPDSQGYISVPGV